MARTVIAFTLVMLAGLPACAGQQPASSPAAMESPASPAASAVPSSPTTAQELTFTGPIAGKLAAALTSCKLLQNGTQLGMRFDGNIGMQRAMFTVAVNSGYHGPGAYAVGAPMDGGADLELSSISYTGASSANAGNLIINPPDARTGIINADLSGGEHVAGTYTCDRLSS
jgi:hypothetical protein